MSQSIDTVVVGGSQAGLATGYHLRQHGIEHVILDENDRIGAAWRNRWDSLRLFTPAQHSSLPGMPSSVPPRSLPGKDDVADYLETYAERFQLPVRTNVRVERVAAEDGRYVVETTADRISANNVVVATGIFHKPWIPDVSQDLDPRIIQMHSTDYQRPSQVPDGDVLVVGAGSSGAEIATELANGHRVWMAGPDPGQEPKLPTPILWFMASKLTKVTNPIGRKLRSHFLYPPKGIPRGRITKKDLRDAGIEWVTAKPTATRDGLPKLENGRVLDVASVIWCTGFVVNYGLVDLPVFDDYGYPIQERGVVGSHPGLYFMGVPFQTSLSSVLIGGVGRDAEHIAKHIKNQKAEGRPTDRVH